MPNNAYPYAFNPSKEAHMEDQQQTPAPETPSIPSRIWGFMKSAAAVAVDIWNELSSRQYGFGEVVIAIVVSVVIARLL
jgi:hypothetical protein